MQLAIDILSAALGGPGQYIVDFLPHFARRAADDHIHVLASHPLLVLRLPRLRNVTIHTISAGRSAARRLVWQRMAMPGWLRSHQVDALYVPQGLTALASGPPIVVLHQDSMFLCRERYGRPRLYFALQQHFARRTLARAARALFVSKAIMSLAESRGWLRQGAGRVTPYGVDVDRLLAAPDARQLASLRGEPPYLLTVGSVMPHKNVHALIRAMHELARRGRDDIRLKIAGEAPPDRPYANEIRQLIAQLGLADRVDLLGQQDRAAVSALYAAARVYASVSQLEAYGLTLVEAMAFGLPIVCSRLPAFDEVCGDIGVRTDADDPAGIASTIAALWDDAERRADLAQRGRARAALFSWPRAAEAVYDALIESAQSARRHPV